jgi:hypothetical protein
MRIAGQSALAFAFLLGLGCTRIDPSHCGNKKGDASCRERGDARIHCDLCQSEHDGCVQEPPEGQCASTGAGTTTAAGSTAVQTTTDETTTDETDGESEDESTAAGAECGNGIKEPGETCDQMDVGDLTCEGVGYSGGSLRCSEDCRMILFDECEGFEACGNGRIDPGEECDTDELGVEGCADLPQFSDGTLKCDEQCRWNTTGCDACLAANEVCELDTECCDGLSCRDAMLTKLCLL